MKEKEDKIQIDPKYKENGVNPLLWTHCILK